MKSTFLLVGLFLFLAGAAWWALGPTEQLIEQSVQTKTVVDDITSHDAGDLETEVERSEVDGQREEATPIRSGPPSEVEGPSATLRIRLMELGSNVPVEDCALSIFVVDSSTRTPVLHIEGRTDFSGAWLAQIPIGSIDLFIDVEIKGITETHRLGEQTSVTEGEIIERVIYIPSIRHISLTFIGPNGDGIAGEPVKVTSSETRARESTRREVSFQETFTTDESGQVECPFVPGDFSAYLLSTPDGLTPVLYRAELGAEHDGTSLVIPLAPAREVQVVVREGNHQGVEGCRVDGLVPATPLSVGEFVFLNLPSELDTTNADGKAVVGMAVAPQARIRAEHPNYITSYADLSAEQTEITITLGSGDVIRGRVIDGNDAPVVGAEVRGWAMRFLNSKGLLGQRAPSRSSDWSRTTTNENGNFQINGIDGKGFTSLMVIAEGFAYASRTWDEPPQGFHEVVLHPAAPLFGFLHDQEGNPLADTEIRLSGDPAFGGYDRTETLSFYAETHVIETTEDGGFSFPGLSSGEYELRVRQVTPETVIIAQTGHEPLNITIGELSPGVMIGQFQVLDANTRLPLSGIDISLVFSASGRMLMRRIGKTDTDGYFASRPLTKNNDLIVVHGKGYFPQAISLDTLEDGVVALEVRLETASPRKLKIVAADGLPLRPGTMQSAPALHAGVFIDERWFLVHMEGRVAHRPFRLTSYGMEGSDEEWLTYPGFPPDGAVLRLQAGRDGPYADFRLSAGYEDLTLTLSLQQLQHLGFR